MTAMWIMFGNNSVIYDEMILECGEKYSRNTTEYQDCRDRIPELLDER